MNGRSIAAFVVGMGGIVLASLGLKDAGIAWWEQRQALIHEAPAPVSSATRAYKAPEGFVAKMTIPRLDRSVYVVKASSDRDLRRGPGYYAGTTEPGEFGNCIIAGHRDLHFRMLKNVKVGDEIDIESPAGRFNYRVASIQVVNQNDTAALRAAYPRQLTLVTCYPFYYVGPAPKRLIVRAVIQ